MRYSFLVPVYNVEKYLEQCIESMLSQTYTDFEIILVNDGSTDSSGEICNRYSQSYPDKIKVVHKQNEGLVSARQEGIISASGQVCVFVDSDDYICSELLEKVNDAFAADTDTDIVMYSFSYSDKNGVRERIQTLSATDEIYTKENKDILYNTIINTPIITSLWTKAVKTEILKKDPTIYKKYYAHNMGEDWFRSIHLLTAASKIKYINRSLYYYRTNDMSISRSFSPETISKKNMLYVYDRFVEYLPHWNIDVTDAVKRLKARWLNETIYTFSQYYKAAKTNAQRKEIVDYDWKSMMPEDVFENENKYVTDANRQLYNWIENKKYFTIRWYVLKSQLYKKLKEIKKKIIK